MNILGPNARAPLHIGDSSIGQYPSGSWIAEFLIALPLGTLFIETMAWCHGLKKKIDPFSNKFPTCKFRCQMQMMELRIILCFCCTTCIKGFVKYESFMVIRWNCAGDMYSRTTKAWKYSLPSAKN
mgnify:FL=1